MKSKVEFYIYKEHKTGGADLETVEIRSFRSEEVQRVNNFPEELLISCPFLGQFSVTNCREED